MRNIPFPEAFRSKAELGIDLAGACPKRIQQFLLSFDITRAAAGIGGTCRREIQIGAAVMSEQGKTYEEILLFYYRNAEIRRLYD